MGSYQEQYDAAKADGSLLDPMPADYVLVRDIAKEIGADIDWVLGSGPDGPSEQASQAKVKLIYDKNFESYISPGQAQTFKVFLAAHWAALHEQRDVEGR